MWRCIALLLLTFTVSGASAQNFKSADLRGKLTDEAGEPLASATLMLLNKSDSILIGFTTSEADGTFKMKSVKAGDYLLKINFLGFVPRYIPIDMGAVAEIDLGILTMQSSTEVLDEVEVRADHVPVEIRKDTIAYNADAFRTQPNAAVEDLLKKLPGMEVDQEGNIKAQGEDVQNVLVDGKEFFGTDPKLATKNLPADAIDQVEVYDRKSEMAEFSGVDDGEREKTINLKLKEDRKKGAFGNLEAGYGTNNRYNARGNINRFSNKSQLSILGLANNINEQGFSVNEFVNFSGGLNNLMRAGGGMARISRSNAGVPISSGLSDGLAETLAGGVNYNVDIGDNFDLRSSYFYNGIDNAKLQDIFRQDFVNDTLGNNGTIETFTDQDNTTERQGHRVNANLEWDIDSTQQIEMRTNASLRDASLTSLQEAESFNTRQEKTNRNITDYANKSNEWSIDLNAYYRKRFGNSGRTLTLNGSYNKSENDADGDLQSLTEFVRAGRIDTVNQKQTEDGSNRQWGARTSYTEPLGRNKWLEFNYAYQANKNESDKKFFDIDSVGERILNPQLSTDFHRDFNFHRFGTSLRWNTNKSSLNVGLQYQNSELLGFINDNEDPIERPFNAFLPSIRWRYDLATARSLRIDYSTSINVPSLQQLSPIVDNSNPLQIYIGNPQLDEEYVHTLRMRFHSYSQFSSTSIFGMIRARYTQDRIVTSNFINEDLQQITSPVNIDSDFNIMAYGGFGRPINAIRTRVNVNLNSSWNRSQEIINQVAQDLNRFTNEIGITLQGMNSDVIEYSLGAEWTHGVTRYDADLDIDQNYFIQHYFTDVTVNFLKTWSVGTSFDIRFYSGDQFQGNETLPLWKASLSKYIFSDRRGEIRLSTFDILNENRGISRLNEANFIQEIQSNSLNRYFMLSFVYSLKGFGQAEQVPAWMSRRRR